MSMVIISTGRDGTTFPQAGSDYLPLLIRAIPLTTRPAMRLRLIRIISDEEKIRVTTIMGSFKLNEMRSRYTPNIKKKISSIARMQ